MGRQVLTSHSAVREPAKVNMKMLFCTSMILAQKTPDLWISKTQHIDKTKFFYHLTMHFLDIPPLKGYS